MGMGRLLVRFVFPVCSSVWVMLSLVFQCGFSVSVKGSTESAFEHCVISLWWKVVVKGELVLGLISRCGQLVVLGWEVCLTLSDSWYVEWGGEGVECRFNYLFILLLSLALTSVSLRFLFR